LKKKFIKIEKKALLENVVVIHDKDHFEKKEEENLYKKRR